MRHGISPLTSNNTMLKVSIITVCLNEEERIEKTIKSIIDQTFTNIELVVIDGGSTDNTLNILNRYSEFIDIFIPNKKNGVYNAMNAGIIASSGDYVYFMNGGDSFNNNDILERIFVNTPDADILYGNILIKNANDDFRLKSPPPSAGINYLLGRTIPHQSSLTRRSLFKDIGLFDESFTIAADYDFFLRAIVKYSASTSYFPFTFAVWIEDGISSLEKYKHLRESERKRAQKRNLPYYNYLIARKRYYLPSKNSSFFIRKIANHIKCIYRLFK